MKDIEDIYQLTPLQESFLLRAEGPAAQTLGGEQLTCRVRGELNVPDFWQAWQRVADRQPALRTSFVWKSVERPLQVVHARVGLTPELHDRRELTAAGGDDLHERLGAEFARALDPAKAPLLCPVLCRTAEDTHHLICNYNRLILDERSMQLVLVEVFAEYEELRHERGNRVEPAPPFTAYLDWLDRQDAPSARRYWEESLKDFAGAALLEAGWPSAVGAAGENRFARRQVALERRAAEALTSFERRHGLTVQTLALGAWTLLLSRYSDSEDVTCGIWLSGRPRELEGARSLIGTFANVLPLCARVEQSAAALSWLGSIQARLDEMERYSFCPPERLREWACVPDSAALFESVLSVGGEIDFPMRGGLEVDDVHASRGDAPLEVRVIGGAEPRLQALYDSQRYDGGTVARLLEHFKNLLNEVACAPGRPLSETPMLGEAERRRLLVEWNDTGREYPRDRCVHQLFEEQARRAPSAVAVIFGDTELTYGELNERANRLARYLRGFGVGPETVVGLCVERSPEMIAGLLAILKAGGAYVPLDPEYPLERLSFMLEDTQVPVLLTQEHLAERLPAHWGQVILLDADREFWAAESGADLANLTAAENLAYVTYTSGSTGRPKGVEITHRAVARLVKEADYAALRPDEVFLQFAPLAFDASTFEIWGSLLNGARLVVMAPGAPSLKELGQALVRYRVSTLWLTAGLFHLMADEQLESLEGVRQLLAGGDVLSVPHVEKVLQRLPACRLINGYGPTESTTFACCYGVPGDARLDGSVPIGRPITNTRVYLLGRGQRPVPVGVSGELFISGDGLARGYHRRPGLTADRFIPDPFGGEPGARLYRTGDLARYREDGTIEFLGRLDAQVKIAGHRIEPGEVEAALGLHPAVRQASVITFAGPDGAKRLAAYVVATAGKNLGAGELRAFLADSLPEFMLPAAFVVLDALPLTPHGKVDRAALPPPETARGERAASYAAPRTKEERELAEIWAEVLGVERVGLGDNFFELGGDSMRCIQVLSRAERRGLCFTVQHLFDHQTVGALAKVVEVKANGDEPPHGVPPFGLVAEADRQRLPADVEDAYPLAALQLGMLFHSEYSPDSAVYRDVFSFHLRAPFDAVALREAAHRLAARHPVLRTSFDLSGYSEPLQLVHREAEIPTEVIDLRHMTEAEQEEPLAVWFEAEKLHPFDWARAPLLRLTAHRRGEQTFQLGLGFHHAILDGWSVSVLLAELFRLYFSLLGEEMAPLEPPPQSAYRDFIALERAALESEEARGYWAEKLGGSPASRLPRLPTGSRAQGSGQTVTAHVPLDAEVSAGLRRLARSASVPLKSVLLAAHLRILSLLTGRSDVSTGVVSHKRAEAADGDRVLGLFLNTIPFRMRLGGGTWLDLARQTFQAEQESMRFRHYPMAQAQQERGGQPLFETGFNYTHFHVYQTVRELKAGLLLGERVFAETELPFWANFDLDASSSEIILGLTVKTDEFTGEQATAFATYYANTLDAMASDPEGRYELAPLLPAPERRRLLEEWNETAADYAPEQFFHRRFEEQAALNPEAVAVVSAEAQLTYGELNARSNRLARHLRLLGAGPEARVAVCLERSADMLIAVLAILKAGAAYVPLDVSQPAERLAYMLADARARIAVSRRGLLEGLPTAETHVTYLDSDLEAVVGQEDTNIPVPLSPANLAYVIYTSGSTGRPKGTMIEHRSLTNLTANHPITAVLREDDTLRVSLNAPLIFDASVQQLVQLAYGHTLCIIPEEVRRDGDALLSFLRAQRLDVFDCTPSQLKLLLSAGLGGRPEREPRFVLVGGEALDAHTWERLGASLGTDLYNLYGPTECTVDATACLIRRERAQPSIGRPLPNVRAYVLDGHLQPVPTGTPGELYVAGDGLARGYLSRPSLTAARFLPEPFRRDPGGRMYATGDAARYLPDGYLEFLGRLDDQVKLRGFRVEPGEISETLARHPSVREAFVMAREDVPGDQRLVAYVIAAGLVAPAEAELRDFLRGTLPAYMLPTSYVFLNALPLTTNGKVDRRALPPPEQTRAERADEFVAPRDEPERRMARCWEDVLGVKPVGARDNFFNLGGHSLTAVRLMALVEQRFGRKLPLSTLFRGATVEELTEVLRRQERETADNCLIQLRAGEAGRPLFLIHPTGGHVFCYTDLAARLDGGRPLYGLQAQGVDGLLAPHTRVEAMAEHCLNALTTVEPDGPYLLAGWSLGGAVAFEVARQLQSRGRQVALLALLDTRAPSSFGDLTDELTLLAEFGETLGVDWRRVPALAEQAPGLEGEQRLDWLLTQASSAGLIPPELRFDELRRLFEVYKAHVRAGLEYDPGPLAARVILLKASEGPPSDYTAGWEKLAAGGIDAYQVPGTHYTMLREPNVAALAERLSECLKANAP